MIFLSHSSKDNDITHEFANHLARVIPSEHIFYDAWSIKPGDGIIDKMEEGLKKCQFFVYFISQHSLSSEMVKLEWQNALMKKCQSSMKFIPIRLDASPLPALLAQTLCINLFEQGMEVAVRQLTEVISGNENRVKAALTSNVVAYITPAGKDLNIVFRTRHCMEPAPRFALLTRAGESNYSVMRADIGSLTMGSGQFTAQDGTLYNVQTVKYTEPLKLGFSLKLRIIPQSTPFNLAGIMLEYAENQYRNIDVICAESATTGNL